MPSWQTYKGLSVPDTTTGDAGTNLKNDLKENTARQVFGRLGVNHLKGLVLEHQMFDIGQGNVRACFSVVQTTIGILFY